MGEEAGKKKPKATLIKQRKAYIGNTPEAVNKTEAKNIILKKKTFIDGESRLKTEEKQESIISPPASKGQEKVGASPQVRVPFEKESSRSVAADSSGPARREERPKFSSTLVNPEERDAKFLEQPAPFLRVSSGKDTKASPPRGIQEIETKRTGGRAGIVAGRRIDGNALNRRDKGSSFSPPSQQQQYSNRPPSGRPAAYQGRSGTPAGRFSGGGTPAGRFSGGGTPAGRFSGGGTPAGRFSGGGTPAGRFSGGGTPAGRFSGGGTRPRNSVGGRPNTSPAGARPSTNSLPPAPNRVANNKKFYRAKKTYEKRKKESEKIYQYTKKKESIPVNPVPKEIDIMGVITVSELARKMNLKASDLISKLMNMGMMVTINQQIDAETATILADDYECKINVVSLYDETLIASVEDRQEDLVSRHPVVTIMGHVDHGKTKLLDAIRHTDSTSGEHGGITQHIGAYQVHTEKGDITFLDTPGHSAFTLMRARGAAVTDIVILVVAANDGVMPQTVEAIDHAKAAGCPLIVAVNKMDLPEANVERVKQQLSEHEIISEQWGGGTQFIEISALKGEGIAKLLETILLESELLGLKANWNCPAEGKVIESKIDQGRGIVSTILIEKGTLKIGDAFLSGIYPGKVRAMFDDMGQSIKQGTPSMPVEILGFSGSPEAGDPFQVTDTERVARQFGSKRQELKKMEGAKNIKKITLDNLYDSIQENAIVDLKVIVKGDVYGSVEALRISLEKLSTKEIGLHCIRSAPGAIIEDDVNLAAASDAIIIGFHVRPTAKAQDIANREKVDIRKYSIIYDAVEDIRAVMEGRLSPDFEEEEIGTAEVREIFKVPKIGVIAGCMITSGLVTRKNQAKLLRDGAILYTGELASLKRFKEEVKEVKEGYECGISLEGHQDVQVGDIIQVFHMKEIAKKLGASKKNE